VGGEWSVIFPEDALKTWFNVETRPDEEQTLYGVLALKQAATPLEIKAAFRRLSLQWHPDRSREPDAAEQFIRIKHAYDVLSNPGARAKYNAGLALAARADVSQVTRTMPQGYRSPLRCGLIMATGIETLGRFIVNEIHAWEDCVRSDGKILVSSWPIGATEPFEEWV
jgi:curved DNA-binding protein CbpA